MRDPAYQKVVFGLLEQIRNGMLLPGDKLKGEIQLAAELGVSRSTLREGLRLLQEAGYLQIKNGVGSFVRLPDGLIQNRLTTLESVGKMIERAGFQADSICRSVIHRTPEPGWRTALEAVFLKIWSIDLTVWFITQ